MKKSESDQLEYVACNLCGADDTQLVFEAVDTQFHLPGNFKVVECRECGLVYTNPRPTPSHIGRYYPPDKYCAHRPSGKTWRKRAKAIAIAGAWGYDKACGSTQRLLGHTLGAIIRTQIDIVPPFVDGGRILDVGCGNGDMIAWMGAYRWQMHGVDTSPAACELARKQGLEVFCGDLRDAMYPAEFFDVVTMNHALEHTHDPMGTLRECARILKPRGTLIVDVPNFECIDVRLYGPFWHALQVPTHLYHFTHKTLGAVLHAAGLAIERWKFKPALLPFCDGDRLSMRYLVENGGRVSTRALMQLVCRAYLWKPTRFLFDANRDLELSINIAAYATKVQAPWLEGGSAR